MTPENRARRNIDKMLEASGWRIQNYAERDTDAALGVAVREYPLRADQLSRRPEEPWQTNPQRVSSLHNA